MRWILGLLLFCVCTDLAVPPPIKPLPDDDLCLAWVIKDEARGEPLKGQRAVLDVVLKRMEVRKLTACEVVKESKQFSGYKPGMEFKLHKNVDEKDLTRLYNLRKMNPVVEQSTYFHAEYVKPDWRHKMKRILQVGKHIFYVQKDKPKEKTK